MRCSLRARRRRGGLSSVTRGVPESFSACIGVGLDLVPGSAIRPQERCEVALANPEFVAGSGRGVRVL